MSSLRCMSLNIMTSLNATIISSQYDFSNRSDCIIKKSMFRNERCARKRTCHGCELASMAQLDAPLTSDQAVAGLTPAGLATFFRGD